MAHHGTNPFWKNVVADAHEALTIDVKAIHADVFQECVSVVERVRATKASGSVVVYGEPGSGKTHLLARIKAELETRHLGDARRMAKVVYIRLNTTPQRFWRHVRERMVEDLLQPYEGYPCIDWLLAVHAGEPDQDRVWTERWLGMWLRQPHPDEKGIDEFLSPIAGDGDIHLVLRQWMLGRNVSDARARLRGESLPQAALDRLGVAAEDMGDADDAEDRARKAVQTLCKIVRRVPFVFCFDQLESLESGTGGTSAFDAYGRVGSDLYDTVSNAAILSCIQSSYLAQIQTHMRAAYRDRIAQGRSELRPLDREQAHELIRVRLASTPDGHAEDVLPRLKRGIAGLLRKGECYPRKLLAECARLYDKEVHGAPAAPARTREEFIAAQVSRRGEEALAKDLRDEADAILATGLPDLVRIAAPDAPAERGAKAPDVDFAFERGGRKVSVSLCNHKNMTSLAARLRRLQKATTGGTLPADGLVLLRHPHLPISKGAKQTKEYLAALTSAGARMSHPSAEALALLAVMRDILSEARAGDLDQEGETVTPDSVEAWFRGNCPRALTDFVEELFAPSAAPDSWEDLRQELLEWLDERKMAPIDEAAKATSRPVEEIEQCILASPRQFGRLSGPPPVVYLSVPESQAWVAGET